MSIQDAHALLTAPGVLFEMEEIEQDGRRVRAWKNSPKSLLDVFNAGRGFGATRTFVVHEDERVSYDAFARATLAFAGELMRQGVKMGDRVALVMRNLPEWPVVFYGAAIAGAIVTPLNAWWTAGELMYALNDSGVVAAVFDAERYARISGEIAGCATLKTLIVARLPASAPMPGGVMRLEDVIGTPLTWASLPQGADPGVAISPEDNATIFYTSGTTGAPKGALATHRAVTTPIFCGALAQARNFLRRGEAPPAPDPDAPQRSSLVSVPFFHVTGCFAGLNGSVFGGAKLVLMRRFDAEGAMQLIERERINMAGGVPTIAWQLLEHPSRPKYDLSSLESVAYGGAPAAAELVRRLKQEFPQAAPGSGWGMTETCATFTSHSGEDYLHRPESCGPAAPVGDMKIVDGAGATLPVGGVGELLVRGPHVVSGYWNKPEATAATFQDGWLRTGDIARIDEEGFCFIVDRAKDVIIRGGENIYSVEVENVLYDHPAIMDAALVPIPHRTLGEEPGAVVTLKPGTDATEAELKAWVAGRLAGFKTPVRVLIQTEPLARNANGKILKPELKKLFTDPDAQLVSAFQSA